MAIRTQVDINLYQGDDQSFTFNLFTDVAQLTPWNISGGAAVLTVKDSLAPGSPTLFSSTATDGQIGSNFTNGVVVFPVTTTQAALVLRNAVYDVQVTLTGKKSSPAYGMVLLQRQVS